MRKRLETEAKERKTLEGSGTEPSKAFPPPKGREAPRQRRSRGAGRSRRPEAQWVPRGAIVAKKRNGCQEAQPSPKSAGLPIGARATWKRRGCRKAQLLLKRAGVAATRKDWREARGLARSTGVAEKRRRCRETQALPQSAGSAAKRGVESPGPPGSLGRWLMVLTRSSRGRTTRLSAFAPGTHPPGHRLPEPAAAAPAKPPPTGDEPQKPISVSRDRPASGSIPDHGAPGNSPGVRVQGRGKDRLTNTRKGWGLAGVSGRRGVGLLSSCFQVRISGMVAWNTVALKPKEATTDH